MQQGACWVIPPSPWGSRVAAAANGARSAAASGNELEKDENPEMEATLQHRVLLRHTLLSDRCRLLLLLLFPPAPPPEGEVGGGERGS